MSLDRDELGEVLARYPELRAGLPDHADEVVRIASRILQLEASPPTRPALPPDAPAWEIAYWARKAGSPLRPSLESVARAAETLLS